MYVCLCKGLKETDIRQASLSGLVNAESAIAAFGLDDEDCCGRCARNIHELVAIAAANATDGQQSTHTACPSVCAKAV